MKKIAVLGMFSGVLMWLTSVPYSGWVVGISVVIFIWCLWVNRDSEMDPFGIDRDDDEDWLSDILADDSTEDAELVDVDDQAKS